MAIGAAIGRLGVILGSDNSELDKGLKDAGGSISTFANRVLEVATGIGLEKAFEKMAEGIGHAMTSAIEGIDRLGKQSQKIGIPVEELSRLRVAAELSGLSMEGMGSAVAKLAKNMSEAGGNSASLAARAFTALGVSVKDAEGNLRPSSDVMADIAAKFAGMQDGAGKTALAIALFGRAGAEMIPMLNQGRDGLAQMKAEAEKLGLAITEKDFKAAEGFNDALRKMSLAKEGVVTIVTSRLLPAMDRVSTMFVDMLKSSDAVRIAADGLSRAIVFVSDNLGFLAGALGLFVAARVATVIVSTAVAFASMATAIGTATAATLLFNAAKLITVGRLILLGGIIIWATGKFEELKNVLKQIAEAAAEALPSDIGDKITAGLKKLGIDVSALTGNLKSLGDAGTEVGDKLAKVKAPNIISEEQASQAKRVQEQIDKLHLQTRVLNDDFKALAPGFVEAANGLKMFGTHGFAAVTTADQLSPKLQQLNTAMLQFRGAQLTQEVMQPWETFAQKLDRINQLFAAGVITQETYNRAIRQTAVDAGVAWDIAGASIAGSFADIAGSFGKENSKMATVAKAFAIVQAIISAYTGASKALELPFPANIAAAAAVLAKGFVFVANIKSQAVPKFATGGSFTVPGGIGGADRVMVPIRAFPGERVSVDRPAQAGSAAARVIEVRGLDLGKMFKGDAVRSLLDNVIEAVNDGYPLKAKLKMA